MSKIVGLKSLPCKHAEKFYPAILNNPHKSDMLKGKVALVTGGGTGLGLGIAKTLANVGAEVVIASRKHANDNVARSLVEATNGTVHAMQLDVRKGKQCRRIFDKIEKLCGTPCSILVNAASANFAAPSESNSPKAVNEIYRVSALGAYSLTCELYKRSKFVFPTSVLNITATYAKTGAPFVVPSVMAKAACEAMTVALANEFGKGGMRINCIAPGSVYQSEGLSKLGVLVNTDIGAEKMKMIPIGRQIYPEEIGNLAAFLVSEYGNSINGTTIPVDGGQNCVGFAHNLLHDIPEAMWKSVLNQREKRFQKTKDN